MSGPAAAPASGGGMGAVWQWLLIILIVVMLNILGSLTGILNNFFQMVRFNFGAILFIAAIYWISKAKPKPPSDAAH